MSTPRTKSRTKQVAHAISLDILRQIKRYRCSTERWTKIIPRFHLQRLNYQQLQAREFLHTNQKKIFFYKFNCHGQRGHKTHLCRGFYPVGCPPWLWGRQGRRERRSRGPRSDFYSCKNTYYNGFSFKILTKAWRFQFPLK